MSLKLFARLTKIDEAKRQVTGILAQEIPDKVGEIWDFEKSVPHFKAWSEGIRKATDGKSVGNLRVMHTAKVAGRFTEMVCDETQKAIIVTATVDDDNEWNLVQKGAYSGFSIGGGYGDRWPDPANKSLTRYEAKPAEGSLVDNPCIPTATFTIIKADGLSEEHHFDTLAQRQTVGQFWKCACKGHEHEKKADAETCTASATEQLRKGVAVADVRSEFAASIGVDLAKLAPAAAPPAAPAPAPAPADGTKSAEQLEVEKKLDPRVKDFDAGQMAVFEKHLPDVRDKAELTDLVTKIAAREDVNPKAGNDKYGDVEFADPKNKKYPVDTVAHIKAAWNYINKPKNAKKYSGDDAKAIKAKIVAAWKDKIDKDGPPSAKSGSKAVLDLCLSKGLYTVGTIASLLEQLCWTLEGYEYEQVMEGDDSSACKMLEEARNALAGALKEMAAEEVDEILGDGGADTDVDVIAVKAAIGDLTKHYQELSLYVPPKGWPEAVVKAAQESISAAEPAAREALAKSLGMTVLKVGARHSAKDKEHLQAIHDHSAAMGADCAAAKGVIEGGVTKLQDQLTKATDLGKHLAKQVVAVAKLLSLPGDADAADIVEPVTKLQAEVVKLRAMPAPPKGSVLAADIDPMKQAGGAQAQGEEPILKRDGSVDREAMAQRAIRKAHGFTS